MSTKFSTRKAEEHSLLLFGISKLLDQFSHLVQLNHKSLLVFTYFYVPRKFDLFYSIVMYSVLHKFIASKKLICSRFVRSCLFKILLKYIDK